MTHGNEVVHIAVQIYGIAIKYLLNENPKTGRCQEALAIVFAEIEKMIKVYKDHVENPAKVVSDWLEKSIKIFQLQVHG